MAQAFSNKVKKPIFDFQSVFGTANTTPMLGGSMQKDTVQPLVQLPQMSPQRTAQVQSTTPTVTGVPSAAVNQVPNANVRGLVPPPSPVNQSAQGISAASPTFSGIIFDLIKKATEGDKNVDKATKRAESANTAIQKQKEELSNKIAGIQSQAIPLEFQQGRQQVLQSQGADILAGLGEQFSGATNLLNSAVEQRGQTMGALQQAAGLAAPSPQAYGQTTFNPLDGGFSGGGGLPPDVMSQYAQMAASGQYAAIPSFITSNPVLNAQLNVAAKAFNPNFTPVGAQGASGVLSTIPALQSAETAADGIKNTITSYLQSNPQLNPSDLAVGNRLQQWIEGKQLTDPKYQTLFNYLDEYTNTLAPILGVGGNPTNLKTQIAQGFVNAAASGQSITEVLGAISALAKNKVVDMQRGALGQGTSVPETSQGEMGGAGGFAEVW